MMSQVDMQIMESFRKSVLRMHHNGCTIKKTATTLVTAIYQYHDQKSGTQAAVDTVIRTKFMGQQAVNIQRDYSSALTHASCYRRSFT